MGGLSKQWRRLLWHINRSPAQHVVKNVLRLVNLSEVRDRRRAADSFSYIPELEKKANALQRDGFVQLDDVIDAQLLEALGKAGDAKMLRADIAKNAQVLSHKQFWIRLLDEDMENGRMPTDSPFVRFALQPKVIHIISRALGEIPRLDYVLLTLSHETEGPQIYSQLWHRDHDDVRVIKLFVYLTDVSEKGDGPFTFLPGPVSDRFGFSLKSHRPDDKIFGANASQADVKEMIAPRLSVFMVETTRCLHMGSRMAPGHKRLLYTATFTTVPNIFPKSSPRFVARGELSELEHKLLRL